MGVGNGDCTVALVERATGDVLIGKLKARTMEEAARRTIQLVGKHPEQFRTMAADIVTEFHSYQDVEKATGVKCYFATPHRSWKRGMSLTSALCPAVGFG